jgi:acyl-CoA synthetase (AMP-forming)/AMP-acid ligase II
VILGKTTASRSGGRAAKSGRLILREVRGRDETRWTPPIAAHSRVRFHQRMKALMQDLPLSTNMIFRRGLRYYADQQIATRRADGAVERMTYAEFGQRAHRMAGVLDALDLSAPDARVGTFGWNTGNHVVAYFAVPGSGRVVHTINIRLFPEQVVYSVSHAEDEVILVDRSLLPLLAKYLPSLDCVRHVLVLDDGAPTELPEDPRVRLYDEVAASAEPVDFSARELDENSAAAMCYTTGTTGNPKAVVYSHRSTFLHAYAGLIGEALGIGATDAVLPVVPMFHANAWGIPYTAILAGARVVMPGPDLTPDGLLRLMQDEKVTLSAGVPTIWMGVLGKLGEYDLSSLQRVMCGGSAVPRALSEAWRGKLGMGITQGWGMTETSPVASLSIVRAELANADEDVLAEIRAKAGIALPGVEMRIVDEDGRELPWDDKVTGQVEVRGPWVASGYYNSEEDPEPHFSPDGWLRTGDVGAIDPLGYLRLVDRTKDLIKSGGEWISSVELENKIMGHPAVAEAAVIAVPHPKWMERPLACVVLTPGATLDKDELAEFLTEAGVTRWGLPEDVVFVDELPKTSVGKFSKRMLRERFADYQLPE